MDPRTIVIGLANECWVSRCLHVAAVFHVADAIGDDGVTVDKLASHLEIDPRLLRTVLRVLSSRNIFSLQNENVANNEASMLLREDHPASVGDIVRWNGSDEVWSSFGHLPKIATSRLSGFESAFGGRLFNHLSQKDDLRETFNRSMEGFTRKQVASIMEAVDFASYRTIVDAGGGTGLLARSIAENYPEKEVILFELAGVVSDLQNARNISVRTGDFFVDPIPSADLVILMNILHDWCDEEILNIVGSVGRSLNPGGRLFVIEGLIADGKAAIDLLDLGMAVMTGGRQRTRAEYEAVLASAGFRVAEEIGCSEHLSVLVTEPMEGR